MSNEEEGGGGSTANLLPGTEKSPSDVEACHTGGKWHILSSVASSATQAHSPHRIRQKPLCEHTVCLRTVATPHCPPASAARQPRRNARGYVLSWTYSGRRLKRLYPRARFWKGRQGVELSNSVTDDIRGQRSFSPLARDSNALGANKSTGQ
jgi:hypothetical protein